MTPNKSFKELPSVLQDLLQKYQLDEQIRKEQILNNWEKIVGKKIARQCTPVRIEEKTLILQVKTETWKQELALRQGDLLNLVNVQNKYSFVKKIKII